MKLEISQKKPGSIIWRLVNYGLLPTINHLLFERIFKLRYFDLESFESSPFTIATFMKLKQNEFEFVSDFVDQYLVDCEKIVESNNIPVKFGVVGNESPKNRLYAIGLSIVALKPDMFIETGTQHGVSAGFVSNLSKSIGHNIKVISFDVTKKSEVIPGFDFEQIILSRPVRKSLAKSLLEYKMEFQRIIFFHDSDHSYENMYSEFKSALKILDPIAIISDDVSLNKSFSRFCHSKNLSFIQFRLSSGNAAGIAIRNTCNPDGI